MAGTHAADASPAAVPAVLWALFQSGYAHGDGFALCGYAVRLQGIYTGCGADCISAADNRAMGIRPRNSVHRQQAPLAGAGGAGNMGPRRAKPDELSARRNAYAAGDGDHSLERAA